MAQAPPYSVSDPVRVKTTDVQTGGMGGTNMVWPAIIGAVGSIVGGLAANEQSRKNAAKQRDWEERMSATSHQREVEDLRAAGLNPILSGMGGAGAGYHSVPPAPVHNIDASSGAASGLAAARANHEIELLKSQTAKNDSEAAYVDAQRKTTDQIREDVLQQARGAWHLQSAQENLAGQQAAGELLRGLNVIREGRILTEQLAEHQASAAAARNAQKVSETEVGAVLEWINRVSKAIQGAGGAASSVSPPYGLRRR